MTLHCFKCGEPSGTLLVHHDCRKLLTAAEHRRLTEFWHNIVCDRAREPDGRRRCFHCGGLFGRVYVCGDHFPVTKGADEAVRFDVAAGVCSCRPCNTSGNSHRQDSIRKRNDKGLCSRCGFLLAARDGLCYRCLAQP